MKESPVSKRIRSVSCGLHEGLVRVVEGCVELVGKGGERNAFEVISLPVIVWR